MNNSIANTLRDKYLFNNNNKFMLLMIDEKILD